jgi:hypothetical protein
MAKENETRAGLAPRRASEPVVGRDAPEDKQDTQALQLRWLTQRLKLSVQHARVVAELVVNRGQA